MTTLYIRLYIRVNALWELFWFEAWNNLQISRDYRLDNFAICKYIL